MTIILTGCGTKHREMSKNHKNNKSLFDSKHRVLVQGVIDYAIFMLDPTGTVINWNAGAERIKGYRPDEIIGQHFSLFYTDPDRAAGRPARALKIASTTGRYDEEGWRVRKDGSFFWASVVIDAIRDDFGNLIGFAKVTRDITERREASRSSSGCNGSLRNRKKWTRSASLPAESLTTSTIC